MVFVNQTFVALGAGTSALLSSVYFLFYENNLKQAEAMTKYSS